MFNIFKRILIFSRHRAWKIRVSYGFSFLYRLFSALPIGGILYVLFKILAPAEYGELIKNDLWIVFAVVCGSLVVQYICQFLVYKLAGHTGFASAADERILLGNHLKGLPMGAFSEKNTGEITAVATSDLSFIELQSFKMLDMVLNGFLSIVIAFLFMLYIDWKLAVILALTTLFAVLFLNKYQSLTKKIGKQRQNAISGLIQAGLEYVQGLSVIKSCNMTGARAKKLDDTIDRVRDNALNLERTALPGAIRFGYIFDLGIGALIFAGCFLVLHNALQLTYLLMLLIYVFKMFLPARGILIAATVIRLLDASLDRYEEVLKLKPLKDGDKKIDSFDIEFDNVNFAYDDASVIKNMSFKIPEKSMTALVGQSGCGKTTVTSLIARFWDVQGGSVKVGGIDVKEASVDSLLAGISMVFQKVYLFNDSIRNNIKFGNPEATEEQVVTAAKKARCHEFISRLKDGYDTVIGEGGDSLSGGEKQRISIARAILKDAPIILLDEATASIDPENEKYIQEALRELVREKTLVVIAHRLSTIKSADQILVLEDGELREKGTHAQLIARKGAYSGMWRHRQAARGWTMKRA